MKYIRYMLNDHFLIVLVFSYLVYPWLQYSSWIQNDSCIGMGLVRDYLRCYFATVPVFGGIATLYDHPMESFISVVGKTLRHILQEAIRRG